MLQRKEITMPYTNGTARRLYQRNRQLRLKAQGLCAACRKPICLPVSDTHCRDCYTKQRESKRRYAARKRAELRVEEQKVREALAAVEALKARGKQRGPTPAEAARLRREAHITRVLALPDLTMLAKAAMLSPLIGLAPEGCRTLLRRRSGEKLEGGKTEWRRTAGRW